MKLVNIILLSTFMHVFAAPVLARDGVTCQVEALFDACHKPDIPGGFAAAVIKDGKVIFEKAYGFADSENKVPFTTATVADFASVAKQFTGYAVASLVQDGELDLDGDIRRYLPNLPDFGDTITIRQLIYHTSGIRDWVGLVKLSGRYMEDVISDDFLMKLVMNQEDLNFKPGERFQYSNTGYLLLARIVSSVTGQSFPEWMQENVFKPLGMNDTRFSDNHGEIVPHRARSYTKSESDQFENSTSNLEAYGSSSLFSTLDDMIKWAVNYETMALGGRDTWTMMLTKGLLNNKDSVNYGFGVSFNENNGIVNYGHGGSWGGYLSQIAYYPEQRLVYILVSNRDPSGVYVDDELLGLFAVELLNKEDVEEKIAPQAAGVEIDPSLLKDYAGTYLFFSDNVLNFENSGDRLIAHLPWESVTLYAESENKFFRKDFDAQFEFIRDDSGSVSSVVYWFRGSMNPPFRKLNADVSRNSEAAVLCGDYYCPELRTSYRIIIKENRLILWHLHNEDVTLLQRDRDHYLGDKWWCEEIRLVRDQNDRVTGLMLNADGHNVQDLCFVKE